MANLNKVMLIGRLTRDPEIRSFASGGKVAMFGFAVNNRKKNQQTGQWEDEPVFLDVEAFNRGQTGRQMADLVEQHFRKGRQFYIDGHLKLDQWTDKDGQKRSRLKIVVDDFQFLDARPDGASGEGYQGSAPRAAAPARTAAPAPASSNFGGYDEPNDHGMMEPPPDARGEEEIPF